MGAREYIAKTIAVCKTAGLTGFLSLLGKNADYLRYRFFDSIFDWQFGVETSGYVSLDELDIASVSKTHGTYYEPTPIYTFRRLMSYLPKDLTNFTFIDFGCGKGRTIIAASKYKFKELIGVDFSTELCVAARKNLEIVATKNNSAKNAKIINIDATQFDIPEGNCVLYFYNPFDTTVLSAVLDKIRQSYYRSPRTIYVLYLNSAGAVRMFERTDFLKVFKSGKLLLDLGAVRRRPFAVVSTKEGFHWPSAPLRYT